MSQEVETHRLDKFAQDIMHLAQQRGSVFMGMAENRAMGMASVDIDMGVMGKRKFYNQLGASVATEITTRHADTALADTPHARRMVSMRRYANADLIDEHDLKRIVKDPSAEYAESFGWAIGRSIDDEVVSRFFATAATGEDGTGTAAFDTTNFSIASGSVGMTIAKLRQSREILEGAEEIEDAMNPWFGALQARQRRDLLATTEVSSADFNTIRALVQGQINTFLGFTFLKSQRLATVSAERACPFWTRTGMKLAFNQMIEGSIDIRPDKNRSKQIFFRADFGATRMRETAVVRVLCDES